MDSINQGAYLDQTFFHYQTLIDHNFSHFVMVSVFDEETVYDHGHDEVNACDEEISPALGSDDEEGNAGDLDGGTNDALEGNPDVVVILVLVEFVAGEETSVHAHDEVEIVVHVSVETFVHVCAEIAVQILEGTAVQALQETYDHALEVTAVDDLDVVRSCDDAEENEPSSLGADQPCLGD